MPGNFRNLPILMWNMVADEEVPIDGPEQTAMNLDKDGYRYELDEFTPGEHNTFALNDEYGPAAAFLADDTVDRNPAHVTFAVDPSLDFPTLGLVADHAYWLSGVTARSAGSTASIDATSHGFGTRDPSPSGTQRGAGVLTGGLLPAIAYVRQYQTWGPLPARAGRRRPRHHRHQRRHRDSRSGTRGAHLQGARKRHLSRSDHDHTRGLRAHDQRRVATAS